MNGSVTTKSNTNVHLVENAGDLRLGTVTVNAGTAFIKAIGGSIFDADANEATPNVLSGNVWLFASQNIGAKTNRLTTESGKLEAQSTRAAHLLNTRARVGVVTRAPRHLSGVET